jgi:hypothetical protein
VCLVGGNSPTPVTALGSCDGATTQQAFDATTAPNDASGSPAPGPADTGTPVTPEDTGAPPDDAGSTTDSAGTPDANTTLLGTACTSSTQCASDPVYNECKSVSGTKICTATCFNDQECQPPPNGTCNQGSDYCELQ